MPMAMRWELGAKQCCSCAAKISHAQDATLRKALSLAHSMKKGCRCCTSIPQAVSYPWCYLSQPASLPQASPHSSQNQGPIEETEAPNSSWCAIFTYAHTVRHKVCKQVGSHGTYRKQEVCVRAHTHTHAHTAMGLQVHLSTPSTHTHSHTCSGSYGSKQQEHVGATCVLPRDRCGMGILNAGQPHCGTLGRGAHGRLPVSQRRMPKDSKQPPEPKQAWPAKGWVCLGKTPTS